MFKLIRHGLQLLNNATRDIEVGHPRSYHWPVVERAFLKNHQTCAACGSKKYLNVHHIKPFHIFPEHELDPLNLITLCMEMDRHCHLLIGHGDAFRYWNEHVISDAKKAAELYKAGDLSEVEFLIAKIKVGRKGP